MSRSSDVFCNGHEYPNAYEFNRFIYPPYSYSDSSQGKWVSDISCRWISCYQIGKSPRKFQMATIIDMTYSLGFNSWAPGWLYGCLCAREAILEDVISVYIMLTGKRVATEVSNSHLGFANGIGKDAWWPEMTPLHKWMALWYPIQSPSYLKRITCQGKFHIEVHLELASFCP